MVREDSTQTNNIMEEIIKTINDSLKKKLDKAE